MKKVLIVTGGRTDTDLVREVYEEYKPDVVIAADRGMMAAREIDIVPDYVVGDFDSGEAEVVRYFKSLFETHGKPIVKAFNPEKDETDTELAISLALTLSPKDIVLLGATGTRLDHTLANIELLYKPLSGGVRTRIIDEHNVISIHDKDITIKRGEAFGEYFSLIPFTETVKGLSIKGAKYELENFFLSKGCSLGVSNEFEKDKVRISFSSGIVILFQTDDKRLVLKGKL